MTWKIEVASNAAATSWTDRSSIIDRASVRMGGEAFQARIGTGSGFNLADDAGTITLPGKRVVRMIEDATTPDTTLFRGRIGPKGMDRGTRWDGDAKEFDVACDDYNADLGGLVVDNWSRPAETDVARILALHAAFLNGTASTRRGRPSTDLDAATYIPNTFTTMLPAEVYRDTTPAGVISDVVGVTEKECFVTVDGELFYDRAISTAYAAGLAISDVSANGTTIFAPIPDGVAGEEDPSEFVSRLRLKYGTANAVIEVSDATAETDHDRWETTVAAPEITNAAKATKRANRILGLQKDEERRYQCAIELLPSQVGLIRYGQTVSFEWAAAGVTAPITVRVRRLIWEPPGHADGPYVAHLELGLPKKLAGSIPGGPGEVTPGPFVPPSNVFACGTVLADAGVGVDVGAWGINTGVVVNRLDFAAGDTFDVDIVLTNPSGGWYAYIVGFTGGPEGNEVVNAYLPNGQQAGGPLTPPAFQLIPSTETGGAVQTASGSFTMTQGMLDFWDTTYADVQYLSIRGATSPGVATGGGQGYLCMTLTGGPSYQEQAAPYPGQPVAPEEITADGTTSTLPVNYPYLPGSLQVVDKTTGNVLVVTETNPDAGTFTLGFTPTAGQVFVVSYQASGGAATGADNPQAGSGTPSPTPSNGAPTTADYLVGTAQAGLSAEIVVGATPGGELGGTWASPTVDATHSGSSHAATQAAAEATAAAALTAHTGDTSDAHDASAISVLDTAGNFTATEVEGVLAELADSAGNPAADTQVWMPLTTVVGGVPELVWDADDSLIPTLVPI